MICMVPYVTVLYKGCKVLVLPISAQIRRNWFHLSRLETIVAIGLQKPYAKLESGTNLVLYEVY
jgi:hypothetical protein